MNKEAFNDFWYWINQRQSIYLKKEANEPKPWTEDSILQEWKFCNVLRTQDKQTRNLIEYVIKFHTEDPELLLFNIFAFRAFNLYDTYATLATYEHKNPYIHEWNRENALYQLNFREKLGGNLTSGAYMIRGREGMPKRESIVMSLEDIWTYRSTLTADILASSHSMEKAYKYLQSYKFWGWGPFTLYQILLDLTYTPMLSDPEDINEWCIFGPGAAKGLREIWPELPRDRFLTAAKRLTNEQEYHLDPTIWKTPLTLQDIEFSLCELGKYKRIKNGGKGKERYSGT